MARIKWHRSDEGYVDSHCGRFEIVPLWCGTTTPQYYDLYFSPEGSHSTKRVRVTSLCDTQKAAKEEAEDYLTRIGE